MTSKRATVTVEAVGTEWEYAAHWDGLMLYACAQYRLGYFRIITVEWMVE